MAEVKFDSLLVTLRVATRGLLFPSESDKPIKAFSYRGDSKKRVLVSRILNAIAKLPAGAIIKTPTVEEFFQPVTETQDWFGPDEIRAAARFQTLVDTLQNTLTNVRVFHVENALPDDPSVIAVYIVGQTLCGDGWAGVRTQLIET